MKIRLGISLVVAIMAVAGLLYLQYVWVQKLYLAEQKRIQTVAFSELDIALGGELIMSSLEWQKRYFNKGINPPRNLVSFDYEEHSKKDYLQLKRNLNQKMSFFALKDGV